MYHQSKKSLIFKTLNSKIFLLVALLILLAIGFGLAKIIIKHLQIKKEFSNLNKKIESLNENNNELSNLIDYLNTAAYQEETARQELGLRQPEEKVVVITKNNSAAADGPQSNPAVQNNSQPETPGQNAPPAADTISNPNKWLRYFFK